MGRLRAGDRLGAGRRPRDSVPALAGRVRLAGGNEAERVPRLACGLARTRALRAGALRGG